MIEYIKSFFHAYISTVGFAIIFNAPKYTLVKSGFAGGLGWIVYTLIMNISDSIVLSTFIAAITVALISEYLAIVDGNPITVYIIPGIIPLVPGFGLYYTMLSIVEKQFDKAAHYGSETLLISVAIAGALVIMLSINTYIRQKRDPID